ncbi:Ceramide very long chain fatty acid hydroxylase [Mycena indigotica]|uniref:Ceramide very long chain fatty acid hydroxylase n=1 Tax=Mycena indigotica TaxID=2126181 RepID=A0A8H6RY51_9AGAR|nr:Ceramide very long chain fatty acid hydroxylase [Mycena indigotica]KAF7289910.1 Ceramide very long chain fatty acid hydroxylase [Mycena indigotica]
MSKQRVRIYTAEDVAAHCSSNNCWLSRNGKVYDISRFINDHPGGDDIILKYAGKAVDAAMAGKDGEEHQHSDAAYEMLDEYQIGKLGTEENIVSDDWVATDDFHPENTDSVEDFKKNQFLDLSKPLLWQVWQSNFSKSYYLRQIHQPRHVPESARLFASPILEATTRTVWWVVPLFWTPIFTYLGLRSLVQFNLGPNALPLFSQRPAIPLPLIIHALTSTNLMKLGTCFLLGNLIWTILEYTLHRFLFHIDDWLPDHPFAIITHFLMHGVHHYLPMDRLRLVMPPILFYSLQAPFTHLAHRIFPTAVANGIISGAFAFYILYDCMHYALHHTNLPPYMREQKRYHLAHHYKNFELGFGVTSKFWDIIFNTALTL